MDNTKKVIWVCSDIEGTFQTPTLSHKDKEDAIRKLDEIRRMKKLDEVIFSFVSTMECRDISTFAYGELKDIVEKLNKDGAKIVIGPQFGEDGFITKEGEEPKDLVGDNTKGMQMSWFVPEFHKLGYDVKELLYIDDSPNVTAAILLKNMEKTSYRPNITLIEKNSFNGFFASQNLYPQNKLSVISNQGKELFKTGISEMEKVVEKEMEQSI